MTNYTHLTESVIKYLDNTVTYNTINEAYIDNERKKEIDSNIKKIIPKLKFKSKFSLSIIKNARLVVKIKSTELLEELLKAYQDGNTGYTGGLNDKTYLRSRAEHALEDKNVAVEMYGHSPKERFKGSQVKKLYDYFDTLEKAIKSTGWHDKSEPQSDHFDTDFYIELKIYKD